MKEAATECVGNLGLFTEILFEKYVHSHVLVVRWSEVCCCFFHRFR